MPFYQKGDVRIRYEEAGSGFPLLVTPGGGLNSRVSNWPTAVINAMEEFKNDFRCITMDQRNANGGESTGPVPTENAWDAFADDQLGLMDHLGIREFFYMGYCIGGCFAGKLLSGRPQRVVAAVFCQSVGHRPEDPEVMYRHSHENWVSEFRARRPEVTMDTIEKYFHDLYAARLTSCTACRATSSRTAAPRYWSCRTTPRRTRCRPRSMSPRSRPTPRSRSSHGASRKFKAAHDHPRPQLPKGARPNARRRPINNVVGWGVDGLVDARGEIKKKIRSGAVAVVCPACLSRPTPLARPTLAPPGLTASAPGSCMSCVVTGVIYDVGTIEHLN